MDESQNVLEHEKIYLKIEGLKAQQEAAFYMIDISLKDIKNEVSATLDQAKKTNGRVTVLEDENYIYRLIKKHKFISFFLALGIFKFLSLISVEWIINQIIKIMS